MKRASIRKHYRQSTFKTFLDNHIKTGIILFDNPVLPILIPVIQCAHCGFQTMSQYLKAAVCALDDRNKDWKNRIIEQNYARLDVIIKECYEKGKHKEALQAIDLQNKLAGVYEQRLKIDSPIFTIKIGDNENDENINNGSTDNTTAP